MRFVEKENELRFFRIANFRQILEQLREHPEQKRGVNFRRLLHQLVRGENVDDALATLRLNQVLEIQRRLAKKFVRALRFEREETALYRSGTGGRDIPILRFELIGIVRDVLQHGAQIFEIEKEQAVFVGDLENDVEHAFLRVVQLE